jgi:transposase
MAKTRSPYTPEFRRQMVELVHSGRSPEELARSEPTVQCRRADGGLTTAEREERRRLRRENRQLRLERGLLSKAAAWFAWETNTIPAKVPVRERSPGRLSDRRDVPATGCLLQRLHAWAKRWPSRRSQSDAALITEIRAAHAAVARHLRRTTHSCRACGHGHPHWPQVCRRD